jgi:hypothetical protein
LIYFTINKTIFYSDRLLIELLFYLFSNSFYPDLIGYLGIGG